MDISASANEKQVLVVDVGKWITVITEGLQGSSNVGANERRGL